MYCINVIGVTLAILVAGDISAQQNRYPVNGPAASSNGTIVVQVSVPPSPWHKSTMKEQLLTHLSRKANGTTIRMEDAASESAHYCVDTLIAAAEKSGARFVVTCAIASERLERRKTFNFPLFFHKYQTIGVIEGEMRILDVKRRKIIVSEPFRTELNGPRIFQGSPEDDINDPDLHIDATSKSRFFAKLEEQAVDQIATTIQRYARGK